MTKPTANRHGIGLNVGVKTIGAGTERVLSDGRERIQSKRGLGMPATRLLRLVPSLAISLLLTGKPYWITMIIGVPIVAEMAYP